MSDDGATILVQRGKAGSAGWYFYVGYPCSGDAIHNGGGNYAFADGHSKRISGDPTHYVTETTGANPYYYMTYLDVNH